MLPQHLIESLGSRGSPDLQVHIIRLDGHLLPGLSGAPLINTAGEVVGIDSGGLADGAAGVSWAIAASYLKNLATGEPFQATRAHTAGPKIFFASEEGVSGQSTKCGDLSFTRIRSSTIGEISRSSDNPTGFVQIASNGFLPAEQVAAIPMDIYEDTESGGSFSVPSGAVVQTAGSMCRIDVDQGKYVVWVASTHLSSPLAIPQMKLAGRIPSPGPSPCGSP